MLEEPIFDPSAAMWAHNTLIQALIIRLIESHVLTVEDAQSVFDMASQRAKRERERAFNAGRLIQYFTMVCRGMICTVGQFKNEKTYPRIGPEITLA